MQYFTGSKAHNIALRDRAMGLGLQAERVRPVPDGRRRARRRRARRGHLRRARPRLGAARAARERAARSRRPRHAACPALVERGDLRGDLHMHTTETRRQGRHPRRWPPRRARRGPGLHRDHRSQPVAGHGERPRRTAGARARRAHPRASTAKVDGVRLLAGIECDIRPDGTLDLADDCLAALDLVVASVHSAFNQDREQMTERLLQRDREPARRRARPPDGPAAPAPGSRTRSTWTRSSTPRRAPASRWRSTRQVDRLDLSDVHARLARDRGVRLVISSDSHSRRGFAALDWGVVVARRAWLEPRHVLNTLPFDQFRGALRRHRVRRP